MALFDFLNSGIGGSQQAAGPNQLGEAGVGPLQPIGPTWGDTLSTANALSSRQPQTVPPMTPPANNAVIQPLQPVQMQKTPTQINAEQGDDSLGAIISMLLKLFAV